MKKEQVLDLMNAIPPELIEEADIQASAKRRPGFLRTGVIAACLCLALLGTTFAAVRYFWVEVFSNEEHSGYKVYGEFVKYPVDQFSAQLLADCESWDGGNLIQLRFDAWEEVKAYLGGDIPCVWPKTVSPFEVDEGWSPIHLCLWQDRDNENKFGGVEIYYTARYIGSETERWIEPHIEMFIATEYFPNYPEGFEGTMGGFEGDPKSDIKQLEDYHMSNGSTAGIVMMGYPLEDRINYECIGNFVKDGIRYQVTTRSIGYPDSPEDIEADLKTILDLFP